MVWAPNSLAIKLPPLPVQEVRKKQRLSIDEEDGAQAAVGPPLAAPAPSPGAVYSSGSPSRLVLVWDLDETLLVFNSLLVGTFQAATQREGTAEELRALGQRWEAAILSLCDRHFFFEQVGAGLLFYLPTQDML